MSSLQIMQAFKQSHNNSNNNRNMQRQRNTMGRRPQQMQQQRHRTPFCSFCKHAGKSYAEYTSHYPKDRPGPEGKVICPTILASECSYCHEKGHTKRHCPKLKQRNQRSNGVVKVRVLKREAPQPCNSLFGYINEATKGGEGWTKVTSKAELKVAKKKAPKRRHNLANAFNTLADSDDECEGAGDVKQSLVPAVTKVVKPTGVWGKPLATNVVKDEEMTNPFASTMEEIADRERLAAEKKEQEKESELKQIMRDDEWEAYAQSKYEQEVEAMRDYDDDYFNDVHAYDEQYDGQQHYEEEYDHRQLFLPQTDNSAW